MEKRQHKYQECAICGRTSLEKRISFYSKYDMALCPKHYNQLVRYGTIIDPSGCSERDKNKIIFHDNYAEMIVHNYSSQCDESVLIDLDDVDRVAQYKWHLNVQPDRYNYKTVCGYCNGKTVKLHRFIMMYDGNKVVDHINRNTLDNRKCNLRIVTATQNKQNVDPCGIYIRPNGKWSAAFQREKKQIYVGTFNSPEEAKLARNIAIQEYDSERSKHD